jgi:hypothetical protein
MDSNGDCPHRPEVSAGQSVAPVSGAETRNLAFQPTGEEAAIDTFLDIDWFEDKEEDQMSRAWERSSKRT